MESFKKFTGVVRKTAEAAAIVAAISGAPGSAEAGGAKDLDPRVVTEANDILDRIEQAYQARYGEPIETRINPFWNPVGGGSTTVSIDIGPTKSIHFTVRGGKDEMARAVESRVTPHVLRLQLMKDGISEPLTFEAGHTSIEAPMSAQAAIAAANGAKLDEFNGMLTAADGTYFDLTNADKNKRVIIYNYYPDITEPGVFVCTDSAPAEGVSGNVIINLAHGTLQVSEMDQATYVKECQDELQL